MNLVPFLRKHRASLIIAFSAAAASTIVQMTHPGESLMSWPTLGLYALWFAGIGLALHFFTLPEGL